MFLKKEHNSVSKRSRSIVLPRDHRYSYHN